MEAVHPFIRRNRDRMVAFLDELSVSNMHALFVLHRMYNKLFFKLNRKGLAEPVSVLLQKYCVFSWTRVL